MKVFASWSGEDSKAAAEIFRDWLPTVLQDVEVWVSSRDISRGEKWTVSLWDNLSDHDFGIVLLTKQNVTAPWILFETGALSKSIKSRVVPILLDVDRLDVARSPLGQLQSITTDREEVFSLIDELNSVAPRPIDQERLKRTFAKWWPDLESLLKDIRYNSGQAAAPETDEQRLDRIENALSSIIKSLKRSEARVPPTPILRHRIVQLPPNAVDWVKQNLIREFPQATFSTLPEDSGLISIYVDDRQASTGERLLMNKFAQASFNEYYSTHPIVTSGI